MMRKVIYLLVVLVVNSALVHSQYYLKDQTLGCDGIIGSGKRVDRCGVCGGDNTSCKIISGIFTKKTDKADYMFITEFPVGAANINITEARNTRNYLALRLSAGEKSIINGNWSLDWSGDYPTAGSVVEYRKSRQRHVGENIYIKGPITEEIQLLLLAQTRNPGIYYSYAVPVGAQTSRGSYSLSGQLDGRESGSGTVPASTGLSYPLNLASLSGHRADLPRYVGDSLGELFTTSINSRSRLMFNQLNQFKTETAVKEAVLKILGEKHESGRAQVGRPPIFERSPNPFNESYLPYDNVTSHPYDNELEWYLGASSTPATRAPSPSPGYAALRRYSSNSKYQWKSIDTNQCSRSCGEGFKDIKVVCVLVSSQVTVTDENCYSSTKPEEKKIKCNTQPCPPEWEAGEWSSCSATCGRSTQSRPVSCKRRISANQIISVYAWNCDSSKKPSTVKMCSERDCYNWDKSEWSECSVKCGAGTKTRKVHCVDSEKSRVDDGLCILEKPRHIEKCYSSCEESWFISDWNNKCMEDCNMGNETRQVYCPADSDSPPRSGLSSRCGERPDTVQACATRSQCRVTGNWFAGEWKMCVGDCNEAQQKREVICMIKKNGWNVVTYDQECAAERRPRHKQKCRPAECDRTDSKWFATDWSECSITCGEGYHRRQVKCLDASLKEATNCAQNTKPLTAKPCSKEACPPQTQRPHTPNCRDKYSSCQVVVQARLCKLPYYSNLCCESCSLDSH